MGPTTSSLASLMACLSVPGIHRVVGMLSEGCRIGVGPCCCVWTTNCVPSTSSVVRTWFLSLSEWRLSRAFLWPSALKGHDERVPL